MEKEGDGIGFLIRMTNMFVYTLYSCVRNLPINQLTLWNIGN